MQSPTYSCRSRTARASPWPRLLNALAIAAVGALLMFIAAAALHVTAAPHPAVFSHGVAIATDLTASLDAPAFSAGAPDCDTDARRSAPEIRADGDTLSPFPDLALDERDDDDDDDLHRTLASARSPLRSEHTLETQRCRLLEGALSERQTPSEFLTESVRRM